MVHEAEILQCTVSVMVRGAEAAGSVSQLGERLGSATELFTALVRFRAEF